MSTYVNSVIKSLLKKNECCIDNSSAVSPDYTNTDKWELEYTLLNFSKMNVPFRNRIIISPLYNENNQLVYLMGVSYNKKEFSPTNVIPTSIDFVELTHELDLLNAAISLTTPFSPFIIQYVNTEWQSLCGYKLGDVEGKTFKFLREEINNLVRMRFKLNAKY
jgi:hypothetical protein